MLVRVVCTLVYEHRLDANPNCTGFDQTLNLALHLHLEQPISDQNMTEPAARFFEIRDAKCRGPGLKQSRSYRLRLKWIRKDDLNKKEIISPAVNPVLESDGVHLACEWTNTSQGKRIFTQNHLPSQIMIKLQYQHRIGLWESIVTFKMDCVTSLDAPGEFLSKSIPLGTFF
ncbi:hypothetical protein DL93DRAFT_497040 [Clavulina sp. PMI_390]|nr:hypothetical protein DL93DRAFT_497040 [Clavulina sp. PMI_390]